MSFLIVGASVAGTRTAIALRQRGFSGHIVLLESEEHWPYDKPPLSKDLLAEGHVPDVPRLLTPELAAEFALDVRLGMRATGLDPARRVVFTHTGDEFSYERLVIATGAHARSLPIPAVPGVHTLRTLDDATALREALAGRPRVAVVGAGFIGAEFASAARGRGLDVTLIEALEIPMSHVFGDEVGREISSIHTLHGAGLVTGARVERFLGSEQVEGVALAGGTEVPADLVVVGVGAVPNTHWLADSGLPIDGGVHCSDRFEVEGFPSIFAIGDLALRRHPLLGVSARIEHWTSAGEQADAVAAFVTGAEPLAAQLPYVWSDQYGARIQMVGMPSLGELAHREGSIAEGRFRAVYTDTDHNPIAQVSVNDPRAVAAFRKNHRRGGSLADLVGQQTSAR
ncbi:p-cumate dioxygenase [Rhodococcus oxybenzonivorans]|uniref:p-cumate dioxygenase n=1 Tax=Rhodococcus oxybenzonivorans TaxID=1990687 RepID=A0A2S2C236_9NOCA|nr:MULTISPECIES: FAD-dependent oxidoreductase [Rhodococcus]AWK74818.1 p-cumate dioxygenase [Rhodococcus oxybenzonivorans]QTJ67356.1 FAD-dependent oxidoreductase [Rhodococcus sp. ZPP]